MANVKPIRYVYTTGDTTGFSELQANETIAFADVDHTRIASPAYSATMSVDVTGYNVVRITLTGNLQLGFTGGVDGQKFIAELIQDATGSRTLTYDSSVRFGTDLTATTLTTTANKIDRIGFIYNASAGKYDVIAFAKGY